MSIFSFSEQHYFFLYINEDFIHCIHEINAYRVFTFLYKENTCGIHAMSAHSFSAHNLHMHKIPVLESCIHEMNR